MSTERARRPALVLAVGVLVAMALAVGSPACAQQAPHIGYVYPAGGRQGTSFEVTVGGERLKGVIEAYVSGGGVEVEVGKYFKHLSDGEYAGLRNRLLATKDRLQEQAKKRGEPVREDYTDEELMKETKYTEEELEQMADYRKRAAERKRQLNPQLMEDLTLRIRVAPDAPLGQRELRLVAPSGLSNPVAFHVGNLVEHRETEPNDKKPDPVIGDTLPALVNGQIMPGDVDRFSFKARKGARLVVSAGVRALIPYLADAVPGWFQGVLALYDASGEELAYADAFGFRQDPMLYFEIPKDGEYVIEIRDSIYRGREDFVYRIALGELPYVTSIFPLGGRAGTQVNVELSGWNLPVDQLTIDVSYDRRRPLRSIVVRQGDLLSNRIPFPVDMLTECVEQEPNDLPENAQEVTLPIIVNGRIDRPGDIDVFRFKGSSRQFVIAEVLARRLGSPLDSLLRLTTADGREVAANDDHEDKGAALVTHHADSWFSTSLLAAGDYYLRLIDAQRKGGPEFGYRLYIRAPRPDFELRVVPSSFIARPGACVPFTVYALRKDGFSGEILLALDGAPPGFALQGARVPAGQDKVRLTLTVPPKTAKGFFNMDLEGSASLRGRKLSHVAIPAEDMMQAFAYHHLVPAMDWTIVVTGSEAPRPPVLYGRQEPVKLPVGGTAEVRLDAAAKSPPISDVRVELSEPPDGILIKSQAPQGPALAVVLDVDAKKAKAGLAGNLIFAAFREYTPTSEDGKPLPPRRSPLGFIPAVPFEIVAAKKDGR